MKRDSYEEQKTLLRLNVEEDPCPIKRILYFGISFYFIILGNLCKI